MDRRKVLDIYVLVCPTDMVYGSNRNTLMNVRRRQRRSNEAYRLTKKKQRIAYKQWQVNQIKIWQGMNEQALIEENNLKNLHQRVDK